MILQYLQTICFKQPTNLIHLSDYVGGPAPVKREGNNLVLAWISCLETLLKKAVIRQVPMFCQAACRVCGSGAHWSGEACHTVCAELPKLLELDVLFHPRPSWESGAKTALPLCITWLNSGGRRNHPNHPRRTGALRDQAKRIRTELSTLGGVGKRLCWASGAAWGSTWGAAFHLAAFQRRGRVHPALLPATQSTQSGKQHKCL